MWIYASSVSLANTSQIIATTHYVNPPKLDKRLFVTKEKQRHEPKSSLSFELCTDYPFIR